MIDFFPLKYYNIIYYSIILYVVLVTYVNSNRFSFFDGKSLAIKNQWGIFLLGLIIIYLGLRPITHNYFGDMLAYARKFEYYAQGNPFIPADDVGFYFFLWICSKFMSPQVFFLTCAGLYIVPIFFASKRIFKSYWIYAFIFLIGSFEFWSYGTNGIRNGIASSLFIYALSKEKRLSQFLWITISMSFHFSMVLPALGFLLSIIHKSTKTFLIIWLTSIRLSLFFGGIWDTLFAGLGEERLTEYLLPSEVNDAVSRTGFRWDFLVYGASGVLAGWYFIYRKKFVDSFYKELYHTFLFANAFWILVIRANYSNRFAYLSWFMMGLIIVYPFLKQVLFYNQHRILGITLLVYVMFTFFMNVILVIM